MGLFAELNLPCYLEPRLLHRSMAALTLLQKHIHRRDVSELLDKLALLLLTETLTREQVHALISYLVQAGEAVDSEVFVRELALRVPQHGDALMTIAQQLEQKGIEKGIKQGIEQGIEKGIEIGEQRGIEKGEREATFKIARTMLENGIDILSVMKMTGLTDDEIQQLRH